ncbi:hypothetical protein QBC35DRAFT_499955 [Podospora australis]|uniref:Cytochrome c oxidase assembly protein COX20, mitochondrial n=1 Tax=Podospora australis TaxID=1536484 RepID=A0AAN6WSY7_9PEZI|nr:hypothetical protein QBC35DRAFT_499955 [Podospora australis]
MSKPTPQDASSTTTPPWVQQPSSPSDPSQPPSPPPPAQQKPGGPLSITEAVTTIKPSDFLTFHQAPCSRTGLLTGIGTGAAIGGIRWLMGLPIPRAANWAVGAGVVAASAQYEYCQYQRRAEKEKLKRVVEVYGKVQAEARAKEAEAAREKKAKEEAEKARLEEEQKKKPGWKFW